MLKWNVTPSTSMFIYINAWSAFFSKNLENLFTLGLSFKLKFYQLTCLSHVMDIALKVETAPLK